MSSGNYQEYFPKNWFDFNRNSVIYAFNEQTRVRNRKKKIEALKNKVNFLEEQENSDWNSFRENCIKTETIPSRKQKAPNQ